MEQLTYLSNIANILPYYGHHFENRTLVEALNHTLLPRFRSILGGLFSDLDLNDYMYKYHHNFY